MGQDLKIGDHVRLVGIPSWLIHDLPETEQLEMIRYIGRTAVIENIDRDNYYWIGFGITIEQGETGYYQGHSFCVSDEYLERI